MKVSRSIFHQEDVGRQKLGVGSKKSVQLGHSHFDAQSILAVSAHGPKRVKLLSPKVGKMVRALLGAFFS